MDRRLRFFQNYSGLGKRGSSIWSKDCTWSSICAIVTLSLDVWAISFVFV